MTDQSPAPSYRALHIRPDDSYDQITTAGELADLQALVGGFIECLTLSAGAHLYLHDEGRIIHLPLNRMATVVMEAYHPGFIASGNDILGPAVIAGLDEMGEPVDLPERHLERISQILADYRADPSPWAHLQPAPLVAPQVFRLR